MVLYGTGVWSPSIQLKAHGVLGIELLRETKLIYYLSYHCEQTTVKY